MSLCTACSYVIIVPIFNMVRLHPFSLSSFSSSALHVHSDDRCKRQAGTDLVSFEVHNCSFDNILIIIIKPRSFLSIGLIYFSSERSKQR